MSNPLWPQKPLTYLLAWPMHDMNALGISICVDMWVDKWLGYLDHRVYLGGWNLSPIILMCTCASYVPMSQHYLFMLSLGSKSMLKCYSQVLKMFIGLSFIQAQYSTFTIAFIIFIILADGTIPKMKTIRRTHLIMVWTWLWWVHKCLGLFEEFHPCNVGSQLTRITCFWRNWTDGRWRITLKAQSSILEPTI